MLAVDLGTGGPKVALVSSSGRIVASSFEPVALRLLPGGGAEQDPEAWWSAVVSAARRVVADGGVAVDRIVGLGCTAQWSGTVAAAEDGTPLRPAVIWMDSRGSTAIRKQAGGVVNVLGYDVRKLQTVDPLDRRGAGAVGQGSPGPHPVDPPGRARGLCRPPTSSWSRWTGSTNG